MDETPNSPDNTPQTPEKKQNTKPWGGSPNSRRNLIPFRPGPDPRRHKGGRPKSFEQFRALAQQIAAKEIQDANGNPISVGEAILRTWAKSKEPQLQRAFIEYAFGKVPEKMDASVLGSKPTLILHYGHEKDKRDQDHERLSAQVSPGAD
jgi:hypothetical protein